MFASLHRVAGYGKMLVEDPIVRDKQEKLKEKIQILRDKLKSPPAEIAQKTTALAVLIEEERTLRVKSRIKKGERILGKKDAEALNPYFS